MLGWDRNEITANNWPNTKLWQKSNHLFPFWGFFWINLWRGDNTPGPYHQGQKWRWNPHPIPIPTKIKEVFDIIRKLNYCELFIHFILERRTIFFRHQRRRWLLSGYTRIFCRDFCYFIQNSSRLISLRRRNCLLTKIVINNLRPPVNYQWTTYLVFFLIRLYLHQKDMIAFK